jgi:subtilisin family serine protease
MRTNHSRRLGAALAMTAALVLGGVSVAVPSAPTASAAGPCGPLGTLVVFQLNDRCDYGTGLDPMKVPNSTVIASLGKAGLFATRIRCGNGSLVPIVAAPNQLLISADSAERLAVAVQTVRRRLDNVVVGDPRPVNALATRLFLRPDTLTPTFLRTVVPTLQGRGFSVDLNYLEPAMPNNAFHPFDNPVPANPAPSGEGGKGRVLVVDSPPEEELYDLDGRFGPVADYNLGAFPNVTVDEDHGHGVFVASLVKRLAPGAQVFLAGVTARQLPGVARWTPMLFSDADLIRSMGGAFGLSTAGTAVRQSFDVVNLSLGGAGCGSIADRLPLGRFMRNLAVLAVKFTDIMPVYVAAAGNDGADVKHFPAAWRDGPTIEAAADAIDLALGGGAPTVAGNQLRQIQAFLEKQMHAVGSWTGGVKDAFSNCGTWVDGRGPGAKAVSRYPSPRTGDWAAWSGTSFATPQVSATVVGAAVPGVIVSDAIGACPP